MCRSGIVGKLDFEIGHCDALLRLRGGRHDPPRHAYVYRPARPIEQWKPDGPLLFRAETLLLRPIARRARFRLHRASGAARSRPGPRPGARPCRTCSPAAARSRMGWPGRQACVFGRFTAAPALARAPADRARRAAGAYSRRGRTAGTCRPRYRIRSQPRLEMNFIVPGPGGLLERRGWRLAGPSGVEKLATRARVILFLGGRFRAATAWPSG